MSDIQGFDPTQPIRLSSAAVERLRQLYQRQTENKTFRIYITGGGCSGFQYGFQFDDQSLDDDVLITQQEVAFVVDSLSLQYLEGSEIYFEEDLMGSRFLVQNPNSTTTCSCGASFSI